MKKLFMLLALAGILVCLTCCKQNDNTVRLGVNAEIIEINSNDNTIVALYTDEHNNIDLRFKVDCNNAVKKHQIIYCNYQTHMTQELSFASLQVGDKIILSMDNDQFLQLHSDDIINALQIQLATQRLT